MPAPARWPPDFDETTAPVIVTNPEAGFSTTLTAFTGTVAALYAQVFLPVAKRVRSITLGSGPGIVSGFLYVNLYDEDGALLSSGTVYVYANAASAITCLMSPVVACPPGMYYIGIGTPTAGASFPLQRTSPRLPSTPAGKAPVAGTLVTTAGALVAALTPTGLTYSAVGLLARLD